MKYKSPRRAIPIRTEEAVLAKSRRRCTLCFGLHGDRKEKLGQIAHLDRNRSNNAESNLAWMCLDHHSLFDSTTKQHKNYTIAEVKGYRRQLYKALHSTPERSSRRVRRSSASKPKQAGRGGKVTNSTVASGTNISQTVNSPTLSLSLPAPTSGTPGRERYDEWRELIDEIHESIQRMGYAFIPLVPMKPGDDRNDYQAGIRRGNRVLGNGILIADPVQKAGLKKDWDELVQYTHSARGPVDRWQQGSPTMGGFDKKAREFQEKLMRIAREDMSVTGQTSKNAQTAEEFDRRFPVTVERSVSRMIDRGSGEERKQTWEQRPDIVLEWTPGTRGDRDKGTFRNIGKRSGFSIKTGSFSWPELQFVTPVQINAIHPDKELTVELPVVEKTGPGSMLVGSLDSFMRDQKFKERDDLKLRITFSDSEGHSFEREFTFCAGPGGNFGPRVITSLSALRQI